jgi:hypothetical protein
MKCGWWVRWYHVRQRRAVMLALLPALIQQARNARMPDPVAMEYARQAWERYKRESHHTYWHCSCAQDEESSVLR